MPTFFDPTRPLIYRSPDDGGSTGNGATTAPGIDADTLNRAVADHVGRAVRKLRAEQATHFEELKKLLGGDGLKATVEKALQDMVGDETPANGAPAKPGESTTPSPEIEAMRKELDALKAQQARDAKTLKEREKLQVQAEQRAKQARVGAALKTSLAAKLGPDSKFLPDLIKVLTERVDEDEREQPRMKFQRAGEDGATEDEWVPLSQGIEKWAKEEGAHYVPARTPRLPVAGMGWPQQYQPQDERQNTGAPGMPWLAEVGDAVARRNPQAAAHLAAAAQAPPPKPPK